MSTDHEPIPRLEGALAQAINRPNTAMTKIFFINLFNYYSQFYLPTYMKHAAAHDDNQFKTS